MGDKFTSHHVTRLGQGEVVIRSGWDANHNNNTSAFMINDMNDRSVYS